MFNGTFFLEKCRPLKSHANSEFCGKELVHDINIFFRSARLSHAHVGPFKVQLCTYIHMACIGGLNKKLKEKLVTAEIVNSTLPGTDVMIFKKYFRRKIQRKNWRY
jgi:hypothetical protein